MATELVSKSQTAKQPLINKIMDGDPFLERVSDLSNRLARRAYELFERRGGEHGRDWEDWFHAELELLNPVPVEVSETDDELLVRVDIPGFSDKDIEVRVEPRRLIISGKREQVRDEKKRKTVYTERRSDEVLRVLDLPAEVDPDKVKASLQEGTLEIVLPRMHSANKIPASTKAA